ncbi:MAG: hypothetical protein OXG15_06610 [Gammaproteobacteria bacterium]|nr:hypothetical protein [Gammaproteobacteria bacterium]
MNTSEALAKIFYQPSRIFVSLKEKRSWLVAGLLITLLAYFESVLPDVDKHYDPGTDRRVTITRLVLPERGEEIKQEIKNGKYDHAIEATLEPHDSGYARFKLVRNKTLKDVIFPFGQVSMVWWGFLGLYIMTFCDALYFFVVGSIMKLQLQMRDWLAFSVWSRVPALSLYFISTVLIGVAFGNPKALYTDFFSLNTWFDIPDVGNTTFSLTFDGVNAGLVWILVIQTIGFSIWSRRSVAFSSVVVLIPTLVLYGSAVIWWMLS